MPLRKSWVESANSPETEFPLNNLPYGVFSAGQRNHHCGVAIGDSILDVTALEDAHMLRPSGDAKVFDSGNWNAFMELGPEVWGRFRNQLVGLLGESADSFIRDGCRVALVAMTDATMHMPFKVAEFTDFYAGRHHATNVGTMFRGAENALPPNWLHIPIGYNGRASSVVVSGTDIRRPWGQLKSPDHAAPAFLPCRRFDIELEIGAIVGKRSDGPVSVASADEMIFGYVLLNDWSARDIQAWEYQPLGPFQSKATATSISPWIVTRAALDPFRTSTPPREVPLLPHLHEPGPMLYDIPLEVSLQPRGAAKASVIAKTNYAEMYYSAAQQLAHHTTAGSPMNVGDLLGSGTISGAGRHERGSLLELSWGGKEPFTLDTGETRSFVEDGDTLTLRGAAQGDGYRVGFGECSGTVIAALDASDLPYPTMKDA
ncbi:MAG: fumarylacetoacetase [Rhodobacter sp.]|nr:fumarylacetoacetase [Rhodobacter sp.]